MQPTQREVAGADGIKLNLLEWSREGVALLFLHGYGNDAHVWDDVAPVVAPYYRTLALDQRGHGESSWDPQGRYTAEQLSYDVEALLAALAISRVVLVGHSLGGRVALHFAKRQPEQMAGLVLIDVGPELDPRGVTRIRLDAVSAAPSFGSVGEFEEVLLQQYPVARPQTIVRLARQWLRQRDDGRYETKTDPSFGRLREGISAEEARAWSEQAALVLWDALRKIPCPTLVLRGAASDILDADTAEHMVDTALPDGRLEVIPRASHSVMLDNPEAFEAALGRFVLGDAD